MSAPVRKIAYIPQIPLDPRPQPRIFGAMNTTQTNRPALSPAAHALLADFDHPDLTTPDLARRHNLTLDQLHALAAAPAFQHALALLRALNQLRRPLQIARAHAQAAQTLTALAKRTPTSATAAKEARLAIKDLLKLLSDPTPKSEPRASARAVPQEPTTPTPATPQQPPTPTPLPLPGAEGFQPSDRPTGDTPGATACSQAVSPPTQPPSNPTPPPEPPSESGVAAAPAPTPQTARPRHKPKRPRNTKPRPKARSR